MPPIHTRSIQSWEWRLWVPGRPSPQGSKVMIPIKRGSKAKGTQELTGEMRMAESSSKHLPSVAQDDHRHRPGCVDRRPVRSPGAARLRVPDGAERVDPDRGLADRQDHLRRPVAPDPGRGGCAGGGRRCSRTASWIVGYLGWPQTGKRYARPAEGFRMPDHPPARGADPGSSGAASATREAQDPTLDAHRPLTLRCPIRADDGPPGRATDPTSDASNRVSPE